MGFCHQLLLFAAVRSTVVVPALFVLLFHFCSEDLGGWFAVLSASSFGSVQVLASGIVMCLCCFVCIVTVKFCSCDGCVQIRDCGWL
ncbi:hypothetical protein A2U01_0067069 [Trifolium medium]|uniref:Uncharacterized protein n=1 Tax=Trifolium medium TaxID=97028 RepID=A0A392SD05_9FABA|nr:hypothetical protein [Trifolium medium]